MNQDEMPQEMPYYEEYTQAQYDRYRADFFQYVVFNTSHLIEFGDILELSQSEALQFMIDRSVAMGLEMGMFRPGRTDIFEIEGLNDADRQELAEIWEEGIPWPLVRAIAEGYDIDASKILQDYVKDLGNKLAIANAIRASVLRINGEELADSMQHTFERMEGKLDKVAEETEGAHGDSDPNTNSFILHVVHDGHVCRHPFLDLESAIAHAVEGTASGWLQSFGKITRNGVDVLSAEEVAERVERMRNIGNN